MPDECMTVAGTTSPDPLHGRITSRRAHFLVSAIGVAAFAEAATAVGGAVAVGLGWTGALDSYLMTNTAMGMAFAACGGLIAWHRPRNPVGWLLTAAGVAHLTSAAALPVGVFGVVHRWPALVLRADVTVFGLAWPWGILTWLPLALLLFPDGRLVSPRWRPLAWLTVATGAAYAIASATGVAVPGPHGGMVRSLVSVAWPRWAPHALNIASLAVSLGLVAALVVRYRRADETGRAQLWWLVLAVPAMIILNWQRWTTGSGPILFLLAAPLIPVAITVAILRHGLFDIKLVISRTVLYGTLIAAVALAYAALVALFGLVLRHSSAPYASAIVIALAFNPARVWLQGAVNRVFYGSRRDPLRAVASVGERLAGDDLADVVDGIRDALRLPFAALRAGQHEIAASGSPPAGLHTLPLTAGGQHVGELTVGVRPGDRRLAAADKAVLGLLATPLAIAVRATALADALQVSREHLVAAQEEERRRLHRELHDSLGPALTGAALTADAAGNLITTQPAKAELASSELAAQIRACLDEVRRLAYGLRPPSLDEGLVSALQRAAGRLAGTLDVRIEAPAELPPLPAAVEVAAYRIATEALTNIVRHARAAQAIIRISADTQLRLSITDDGPPRASWHPGLGLTSITERAAEVGGSCRAGPTKAGGAVTAALPLALPGPHADLAGATA
jgi:two-component system, NarL family, sensor kinase